MEAVVAKESTELKRRIKELKEKIKKIEDKVEGKILDDVDSYELQSDLGRRRVDRVRIKDMMSVRDRYKQELAVLEDRLRRCKTGAKQILMRFDHR
jgi:hypothetical protein